MIPIIQQALIMGYTASQILSFLSGKVKNLAPGIQNARTSGKSDEDILKFLQGKLGPKDTKQSQRQVTEMDQYLKSVGLRTSQERQEQKKRVVGSAIGAVGSVLGAYNLYKNYAGIGSQIAQAIGKPKGTAVQGQPPQIGQQVQAQAQAPVAQAMQPSAPLQINQAAQAKDPIFKQLVKDVDITSLPEDQQKQLSFLAMISDKMESEGKTLNDPAFKDLAKKVKNVLKEKPGTAVEEIARFQGQESSKAPEINKGELTPIPTGDIGEVVGRSGDSVLVDVDGKKIKYKLSELFKEPEDIRSAIQEIAQIPETERSAAMDLLHYSSKHKTLHIMFPNGKIAWYEDVDPDIIEEIIAARGIPKTSGKTKTGEEWLAGVPDSRFAVVAQKIIQNPKYAKSKKGETWDYADKTYDKYLKIRTLPKGRKTKKQIESDQEALLS